MRSPFAACTVYRTITVLHEQHGKARMPKTERVELRVDDEFLARVDAWRREQPDPPSRASAIRQLVVLALQKDGPGVRLRGTKGKR
jgi:hypothetical protein